MSALDDDGERLECRMRFNVLYDFYSPLLTERQRDVYEMLYFSDLAPAEVAKSLGITRQAVHILDRRIRERLDTIERDLCFAETVEQLEGRIQELEARLDEIKGDREPRESPRRPSQEFIREIAIGDSDV